ncbi:MAG TPA: GNAT family N-acetyltransferase [Candidatus Acidoferrales bacterium]|jgi:ribosomal protein S18 acetylase RimI-like enzyme|nr:GNAT family N-acetyltransferase [Candidatus Acidoferrales bacterium]
MPLVDLRQLSANQLSPLLEEEAQLWRSELHWDYQLSIELIKRFLELHSLAGAAVVENGRATGYGFYVVEDHKGMLGGLFVTPRVPQVPAGELILGDIMQTMRGTPQVTRIEAQLMPFGAPLDRVLAAHGFRLYPRQFMILPVAESAADAPAITPGLRLEKWHERLMPQVADLIHLAYANHVDGEINDQYRSRAGAMKFLKNIVMMPGCGQFEGHASFVLREVASEHIVGVVLTSIVAPGVGHTTQLCVLPGFQGHGLGRRLMAESLAALRKIKATELSLTVTCANLGAVKLYESLGFRVVKVFAAGVWRG